MFCIYSSSRLWKKGISFQFVEPAQHCPVHLLRWNEHSLCPENPTHHHLRDLQWKLIGDGEEPRVFFISYIFGSHEPILRYVDQCEQVLSKFLVKIITAHQSGLKFLGVRHEFANHVTTILICEIRFIISYLYPPPLSDLSSVDEQQQQL